MPLSTLLFGAAALIAIGVAGMGTMVVIAMAWFWLSDRYGDNWAAGIVVGLLFAALLIGGFIAKGYESSQRPAITATAEHR